LLGFADLMINMPCPQYQIYQAMFVSTCDIEMRDTCFGKKHKKSKKDKSKCAK
jgi:hypothetical protein